MVKYTKIMKVLHVNTHLRGGAGKACVRLHQGLRNLGVDSKILTLDSNGNIPEVYSYVDAYKNPIIKWQKKLVAKTAFKRKRLRLLSYPTASDGFAFTDAPFDITRHPAYQEADIIHFHWVTDFLDYASFFKKNTKPIVWTAHDMTPFTGGYGYEKTFPFEAYKELTEHQFEAKKNWYDKQSISFVCPSKWMYEKAQQSELTKGCAIHHVPNALDTNTFKWIEQDEARQKLRLPFDNPIVLFVADSISSKRKGMELLLEAVRTLYVNDLMLVIAGRFWNPSGKMPAHRYVGEIETEEEMALLYNAADVFVIPSLEDNFPNTVIEALCCGTPVVGFDVGGIPEQVIDGVNGRLCSKLEGFPLKTTILDLLTNKEVPNRQTISKNARQAYALHVQAQRMKDIYQGGLDS